MHGIPSNSLSHNFIARIRCNILLATRTIKTDGNAKKGKVSVVRKRIFANELKPTEQLEIKIAADVIKRFNWENQHLFGDIISAVKKTCASISRRKASKKGPVRRAGECFNNNPVPIKDVISISPDEKPVGIDVSSILEFPMTDDGTCEPCEKTVHQLNAIRQYLEFLNGSEPMPSVTTILEKTMPHERRVILERWKARMIEEMGEEKFKQYQQDMLKQGSMFHHNVSMYLTGTPEAELGIDPSNHGHWRSICYALPCIHDVRILEENLEHPFLRYRGVVDCFGMFRNRFAAIEWKTSKKPKLSLASTYDNPLQLAAYVGALNYDQRFNYLVNKGLLVIAYESGSPATMHFMESDMLSVYWRQWLERVKCYWESVAKSKGFS